MGIAVVQFYLMSILKEENARLLNRSVFGLPMTLSFSLNAHFVHEEEEAYALP